MARRTAVKTTPEPPATPAPGAGLEPFGEATRAWFADAFAAPTRVQVEGWRHIAEGDHTLLCAPTGSGKTLAAFLWGLDRLAALPADAPAGIRVLYVSPLKALAHDVERNLRAPLTGIARAAERLGTATRPLRVGLRTGDTPPRERRQLLKDPPDLLITTPESLYLMLTSAARETLRHVHTVIVDEIHALAPGKRGAHLALSLERLAALTLEGAEGAPARDPQRIGLSATQRPLDEVGRYLGGDRPVAIVDAGEPPKITLTVELPRVPDEAVERRASDDDELGEDLTAAVGFAQPGPRRHAGMEDAVEVRLLELLAAHRSTIVFTNSRRLCERLAQRLNERAGETLVRAHHGSLSRTQRLEIEDQLKAGQLRGLVATSSLELGIDMGAVDLVVQIDSPGAVSRGLQRVGRAGHHVGATSVGVLLPRHRAALLESTVVADGMRRGDVEPIRVPRHALDVLAQQIVAMCVVEEWPVERLATVVGRAHGYRTLPRAQLVRLLDMLAGGVPADDLPDLRPRLVWDRARDVLTGRKDARLVAITNAGTIPDRGTYGVHLGEDGPRIGELDEEMVHESRAGQVFLLGASSWKIQQITRDRVIVTPAPGEPGKMPFWRGEGPGRPLALGRAMGAFVRELGALPAGRGRRWLAERYGLDGLAAGRLVDWIAEQRVATGVLPTDRAIVVERFRDELGDWRVCILTPLGARVHAPWALVIEALAAARHGLEVQAVWSDDGIVLRVADGEGVPDLAMLVPGPEDVDAHLVEELLRSPIFATHFRENAARALLLPRRRAGTRTPLWMQRLRAQTLLDGARDLEGFPITLETLRELLDDVFDVAGLTGVLGAVRAGEIAVHEVETASASPLARELAYAFVSTYLYEGDAPLAERKAQALTLDRTLLAELLGHEDLRELLDAAVIDEVEAELGALADDWRASSADGVHDLLRRLGDLTEAELAARVDGSVSPLLATLAADGRAVRVRVAGEARWIAAEDAGRYRDALGVAVPDGLPAIFLAPVPRALERLVARWARTHGPFLPSAPAVRLGVGGAALAPILRELLTKGALVAGGFRPGGVTGPEGDELCDAEVLRTLRRRTLARLRREVEPVDDATLARFLPRWHGLVAAPGVARRGGLPRLREAIEALEGLPLPLSEIEREILPARVPDYQPRMLDELGAMGEVVWVGHGALGPKDGKIALYRRARVAELLGPPPEAPEGGAPLPPLEAALLAHLETRGASFFAELGPAVGPALAARTGGPPGLPTGGEARSAEPVDGRLPTGGEARSAEPVDGRLPSGARRADPVVDAEAVLEALVALAFRGLVANDTFAPLRARGTAIAGRAGRALGARASGRWFAVAQLRRGAPAPTVVAHARAVMLLERYGVVGREAAAAEEVPGGYAALAQVLRALEEAGKARRGHFAVGLAGVQYARPDAVDRLRAAREQGGADPEDAAPLVLSALDPACPWGALLPWPAIALADPSARPRRVAGARVVAVRGRPILFVEKGGRGLVVLVEDDDVDLDAALGALGQLAARRRHRELRLDRVGAEPALASRHLPRLQRAGFTLEPGAVVLRAA